MRLMPLAGSMDIRPLLEEAPTVKLDQGERHIDDVEILQVLYEISAPDIEGLLPPALNPTIPRSHLSGVSGRGQPVRRVLPGAGPADRPAGVRPRAFLVSSCCDNPAPPESSSGWWGSDTIPAEIHLSRFHDRVDCSVGEDGRCELQLALVDPEPITGHDVQYPPGMHLVVCGTRRGYRPRLVQVDTEYEFRPADRGRPELGLFDAASWGEGRLVPPPPSQPASPGAT